MNLNDAVKDMCLLCTRPVYEDDRMVRFLGGWVHDECYSEDIGVPPRRRGRARELRAA